MAVDIILELLAFDIELEEVAEDYKLEDTHVAFLYAAKVLGREEAILKSKSLDFLLSRIWS